MISVHKILSSIVIVITLLLTIGSSKNYAQFSIQNKSLPPSAYATKISYNEAQKFNKPVVINFYVDWCYYCQHFAPILDNIRKDYESKMSFVMINADEPQNAQISKDFMIDSYPSLYLVNPKIDNRVLINQSLYSDIKLLKREFDRFLKMNNY